MTSSPQPTPGGESVADDWSHRWADDDLARGAIEVSPGRRPRITHLVLVDGLPADHWVEDGTDGRWEARGRQRGSGPSAWPGTEQEARERELRWLDGLVGGRESLLALDDRPLVTRPLDLDALAVDLRARATVISAECDRLVAEVFASGELVAAGRHLFEAVLAADPGMLGRSVRDDTATGALVWAAGQANGLIGPEGQLLARDLWPRLGIPPSAAGRGAAMLERLAPGADQLVPPAGAPKLRATGLPGVLIGATRALLTARRDEVLKPPL